MLSHSEQYDSIFARQHSVEWKISVNGTDYNVGDISVSAGGGTSAPRLSRSMFVGSTPTVGGCVSATFECTIFEASANVPRMSTVVPSYRITDGTETSEWITLGTFYIDTRSVDINTGTLSLYCYDRMLVADGEGGAIYADLAQIGPFPQSMSAVVADIASIMGISVDPRTEINASAGVVEDPGEYTMREILGFIGAANAGNWTITAENKLRLIPITGGEDSLILGTNTTTLSTAPSLLAWSGVELTRDNSTVYRAGNTSGRVLVCECPWATQTMANEILGVIVGEYYQPYTANGAFPDLTLEMGDSVTVGFPGETISGSCWGIDITCDVIEAADLTAPGENEVDHEYPYIPVTRRRQRRAEFQIEELEEQLEEVEEEIPEQIEEMVSQVFLKVAELDFSDWNNGFFSETLEDATVNGFLVDFDASGKPIKVTDGEGFETDVIWS